MQYPIPPITDPPGLLVAAVADPPGSFIVAITDPLLPN